MNIDGIEYQPATDLKRVTVDGVEYVEVKPEVPRIIIDRDGDEWNLKANGSYEFRHEGWTLSRECIINIYGPVTES